MIPNRRITGLRTRQAIRSSIYPTGQSLVHATIYAMIACCAYVAGYHHIAQIVSVMAVALIVAGSISRASKAIAEGIGRLWRAWRLLPPNIAENCNEAE